MPHNKTMTDKVIEVKKGIVKQDLGYFLQRSLRENCNSPETTLLFNLLGMPAMQGAWSVYVSKVWDDLDTYNYYNVGALLETTAERIDRSISLQVLVLYCAFKLFIIEDWEKMAIMLAEEMQEHGSTES